MTSGGSAESQNAAQYFEERVVAIERRVETARVSLRETARWIIGGVALAAAGVITGASLSSLGALGLGWHLVAAVAAIAVGVLALGYLFNAALGVILPLDLTLQQIANLDDAKVEAAVRPLFGSRFKSLREFCDHLRKPQNPDSSPLSETALINLNQTRRFVVAEADFELRRQSFVELKVKTFATAPIIVGASVAFAWITGSAQLHSVPPLVKDVEVNSGDVKVLQHLLTTPTCVGVKLGVIVLGEWPSGAQEVVTVPGSACPAIRLRLDRGRFSPVD